jgi:hypothetical protein
MRWRYANDTKHRESMKKANNDRNHRRALQGISHYMVNPEYREAQSQYHKKRYAKDPEFRQAKIEQRTRWFAVPENRKAMAQRHKERYLHDHEYRERIKQNARERYWKKKIGLATDRPGRPKAQDIPNTLNKSDEPETKA